jgi:hypothetical protein
VEALWRSQALPRKAAAAIRKRGVFFIGSSEGSAWEKTEKNEVINAGKFQSVLPCAASGRFAMGKYGKPN